MNGAHMSDLDATQKRNAARIIGALTCTKLGDVLINPKTVLTWLLTQLGVAGGLVSLLVPIRESGSMLPQLFVSGWVKKAKRRKHIFVSGALLQALAVAAIGASALWLPPTTAGIATLLSLALFATARAFCSISGKDVLGRTIPKGARGRVGGTSATISGVLSTLAALALIFLKDDADARTLAWVVLGASTLWLLGGWIYSRVQEPASEENDKETPSNSSSILDRLTLVRDDPRFRQFIVARILLLGTALASPLMVVLAGSQGGRVATLGAFVIASGIATTTSSFLWGKLADRASHLAMALGGGVAACIGGAAWLIAFWSPPWASHALMWPAVFLLFNIGYSGVRLGRKTWVVDAAEGDQRTDYVSAANTIIAVAILVLGAIAAPLQAISPLVPLATYSSLCLLGALAALRLKPSQTA
jgi:MFS family permease